MSGCWNAGNNFVGNTQKEGKTEMIILNGKKFAESEKEFTGTLFEPDGTAVGYAKRHKFSITLYNHKRKRIGGINRHKVLFKETEIDGKAWYSYADIPEIGAYESYRQKCEECQDVIYSLTKD